MNLVNFLISRLVLVPTQRFHQFTHPTLINEKVMKDTNMTMTFQVEGTNVG